MRNHLLRAGLAASCALLVLIGGCAKKGSGTGTRTTRPGFSQAGTILQNGNPQQIPPTPSGTTPTTMDPGALQILATCLNLDPSEVETVVGWTDPTLAETAAHAFCDILDKTNYKQGILATAAPVDVNP